MKGVRTMKLKHLYFDIIVCAFIFFGLCFGDGLNAQVQEVKFTSERWEVSPGGKIVEFLGRTCLYGSAELNDVEFENGIIEVDVAFSGARAFGGLVFRTNDNKNREEYYLRPHKSGLPDAQQYVPVFNGVSGWQLYVGNGFTASAEVPHNEWIHLKIEVKGNQARVYLNDGETPSMVINELRHDVKTGGLGVYSSTAGQPAYYSNFRYEKDDNLTFDKRPEPEEGIGILKGWEISQNFKSTEIDINSYPDAELQRQLNWTSVETDYNGLVNVSKYINRKIPQIPDVVFARTSVNSLQDETKKLQFGYSDIMDVYLNGEKVFGGQSAFRQRDPNYLGAISYLDEIYLPFKKGENELLIMLWERSGGWGFQFRDGDAEFVSSELDEAWENEEGFKYPEAAVYDSERDKIYVSNYNFYGFPQKQFISKMNLNGEVQELEWLTGFTKPTGMLVYGEKLYIADLGDVHVYDLNTEKLLNKYSIQGARLLQDFAVDNQNRIYLSDGLGNKIFRQEADGEFKLWLQDDQILRPNGLHFHNGQLLVGTFDATLKVVDPESKAINVVHKFNEGVVDGIEVDKEGNIYVSVASSMLFRINSRGEAHKLLDLSTPNVYISNFDYIPDSKTFVIPSLSASRVFAYRLK